MKHLIHNAIIINRGRRFRGYVEIEDRIIRKVSEGNPGRDLLAYYDPDNSTDIKGHWLIPGVIDSHVHFRDPGLTHKADIESESRAAVAGGVTSFIDMPNTKPPTLTMQDVENKMSVASEKSLANYAFYIGASDGNIDELKNADYTRVPGIKLFLGASTGNMAVTSDEALDKIFSLGRLVSVHCEDQRIIDRNISEVKDLYPEGEVPVELHPEVRSALACYRSTLSAIRRAERFGTRLHVCHLSTAEELRLIEAASPQGITAEACVAHLWFTDEDYPRLGTKIKCNPSVKSALHRDALRKALNTGAISVVSTDHAPHTLIEKEGDCLTAPSGMPMIQFSLRAMLALAREGVLTPERVVQLMCHNQADLFGIDRRGYIDEGCYADLVEVDPEGKKNPVSHPEVVSKCGWTPLEGALLPARIARTWVNGNTVYEHEHERFASPGLAMPLRFHTPE